MGDGDTENSLRTSKRDLSGNGNAHTQASEPSEFGTDFTVAPNVTEESSERKQNDLFSQQGKDTPTPTPPHRGFRLFS